jgi:hypothetical protein
VSGLAASGRASILCSSCDAGRPNLALRIKFSLSRATAERQPAEPPSLGRDSGRQGQLHAAEAALKLQDRLLDIFE